MKCSRFFLVALLVMCSLPLLAAKKQPPAPMVTETEVWFDDVKQPAALTAEQGIELTKQLRAGMLARKSVKEILASISYDDATPRVLFLTLGDGIYPGRTYYASGSSFKDALGRLLAIVAKREPEYAEAIKSELEGQVARAKEEYENMTEKQRRKAKPNPLLKVPLPENFRKKLANPLAWDSLRLDVVQATLPIQNFVIAKSRLLLTSAVGIAFDPVAAFAFTPEQLIGRCLTTPEHQLSIEAVSNFIAESGLWGAWKLWTKMGAVSTGFNVNIFESDSYYADAATACRLFRGHPVNQQMEDLQGSALALAKRLGGMMDENGKYERPFLEWVASRPDGKAAVWDQSQLVVALVRTALLDGLPSADRRELLTAARAAVKPVLKSIKHFDPGELGPDFVNSTAPRKPASQRLYAAVVEDESVEGDYEGGSQMEISRRLMELEATANAYLALAELCQVLPDDDATAVACRAELTPLMNYLLTQIQPNGEFVAALTYPDAQVVLDWQPSFELRMEIASLCGLAMGRHLELFPEASAKLNLAAKVLMLRNAIAELALGDGIASEYPLTPWLAEFLAQDAETNPEHLAQLVKLGMAATNGLEKRPFLPDMFGATADIPSMTYSAERLWLVGVVAEAVYRQGRHDQEAAALLNEAWPLAVFAQQAEMTASSASALPHPKEYVGFYRDNLADYGFTMNGQVTQLLARLQLISVLGRGSEGRFTPLPEDVTAYEECWKHLDAHPVVLAPELVIRSSVSGSGNDRALGGNIDTSKMTTRQITVPPEGQKKNGSQDSRVIRRKK